MPRILQHGGLESSAASSLMGSTQSTKRQMKRDGRNGLPDSKAVATSEARLSS